ncbi:uncharacterized protein BP5553_08172 [Venustampulla echinocandica]|uniref:2EXR domain-containing protein n=1 Tax=Venustampulla echinocandica TaxID=2656787 RepID=A0A370TFY0_9HELO|nr:uncharacterized protein BP5553_08172 [Venustampulla echinocandica]RDL33804.1 hypothetical protein BP5553_08172 [Venustampulla echinocandica]
MDNSYTVNNAMVRNLPDAGVEVFPSQNQPNSFTVFPKLPSELRLKIWRSAFPLSRTVGLEVPDYLIMGICRLERSATNRSRALQSIERQRLAKLPPMPMTLRINRESREETLRHYCVLFPGDIQECSHSPLEKFVEKPICLNARRDRLFFSHDHIRYYVEKFPEWLKYIASKIPSGKGLKEVSELEIGGVDFHEYFRERHEMPGSHLLLASIIQSFEGLTKLYITPHAAALTNPFIFILKQKAEDAIAAVVPASDSDDEGEDQEEQEELCRRLGNREEWLRRIFNVQKERFGDGKAPEIVLRVRRHRLRLSTPTSTVTFQGDERIETIRDVYSWVGQPEIVRRFPGPEVDNVLNPVDWKGLSPYLECLVRKEKWWLEGEWNSGAPFHV